MTGAGRKTIGLRPLVDHPLQVLLGLVGVDEAGQRRGDDPVVAGEAPVVVDPAVEGPEGGVETGRVVLQALLDTEPQRRQQEDRGDTLGVHHRHPGRPVPVLGPDRLHLHQVLGVDAGGVLRPVVVGQHPRLGHRIERGVRHHAEEPVADQQPLPPVELHPADGRAVGLLEVAAEGVLRLVVVLVDVVRGATEQSVESSSLENLNVRLAVKAGGAVRVPAPGPDQVQVKASPFRTATSPPTISTPVVGAGRGGGTARR